MSVETVRWLQVFIFAAVAVVVFIVLDALRSESAPAEPECDHEWGKWRPYGFDWQRRDCVRCGLEIERTI